MEDNEYIEGIESISGILIGNGIYIIGLIMSEFFSLSFRYFLLLCILGFALIIYNIHLIGSDTIN